LVVIGKDVPRTDAVPKVTGAAQYVADIHLGVLHAAVLRSPHPHARIKSIDTSAAPAVPGVKAVMTGADTARKKWGCFRPDLVSVARNNSNRGFSGIERLQADGESGMMSACGTWRARSAVYSSMC
jgi:CO/xanthine dehydrogenase Mo-binding subunit